MKKLILLLTSFCFGATSIFAQCSQVKNNFELKLTPQANHTLLIQMRHHQDAVLGSTSFQPNEKINLFGLVFAIAFPKNAKIEFTNCVSETKPFHIEIDRTMDVDNGLNKTSNTSDQFQTFVHTDDMPIAFANNWTPNEWYTIATITYKGNLAEGEFFSLMNCDYGLANPNSYSGNSHTDPWFSMLDITSNEHFQFSPKMITEMPNTIENIQSYNVYPNPTLDVFNININSNTNSQVVISLSDVKGQLVQSQLEKVQIGTTICKMDVAKIASGNYLMKITDGKTINYIQKVQKD
jgi:Secretion system C-terminal sorting domain